MKIIQKVALVLSFASLSVAASAKAQCSTVNLVNSINNAITSYQVFPINNTICRFGGDFNGVRGVVSCLSLSSPITATNQSSYQNLLASIESKFPLTPGQITTITNSVNHSVISYVTQTAAQDIEMLFLNKTELLQYVNGYPLVGSGPGSYRKNVSGELNRVNFTPAQRTGLFTSDATMVVDISGNLIGISGYDRASPFSRFMIYRLVPATVVNNFASFQVCLGNDAIGLSDTFHRLGGTIGGISSLTSAIRYIRHD